MVVVDDVEQEEGTEAMVTAQVKALLHLLEEEEVPHRLTKQRQFT